MPTVRVARVRPGEARVVLYPAGVPPRRGIIVVNQGGVVRAYWNVCQHLPIPLDSGIGRIERSKDDGLICNTHGAVYDPISGLCTDGPCVGESLESLSVRETPTHHEVFW